MFAPKLPELKWYQRLWCRLKFWWFFNIYPRKVSFPTVKNPSYGISVDDIISTQSMINKETENE